MSHIRIISRPIHCLFLVFLFFILCSPVVLHADALYGSSGDQPSARSLTFKGYLSTKYVYRTAESSDGRFTDQDLFGELRMDMTLPKDKYEVHFFGTVRDDLSGNRNSAGFYPLEDIGDTYRSRVQGYLYDAHLDINRPFVPVTQMRLGRQWGTRDEPVVFDGLAADVSAAANLNLTIYGGAAVHLYEISDHWGDDALAGAGLDYSLAQNTWASLDYLSIRDEHTFPAAADLQDRMISLKLWHSFPGLMKAAVKYRYLNGEPRDVGVRTVSSFPEADAEININYFRQFRVQDELSNELSPYFDILGRSSPYQSYDLKLRKLFGQHYAIDLGYFNRALLEEVGESSFDRDYSRAFFLFELADIIRDGLSFTIITERWETGGRDYSTAGLDAGYRFQSIKKARMNVGTYYSLYKYDYYAEQGFREKVRTYYINGSYPAGKSLFVNGSYEREDGIEIYQTFRLGMRYDF